MKKHITFILCCTLLNAAVVLPQNETTAQAELTLRYALAKAVLDHPAKFTPEVIAKAQAYQTTKGYKELLTQAQKIKKNAELLKAINAQLQAGTEIMEKAVHPDADVRKKLSSMMDIFEDETEINKYIHKAFNEKDFTKEEVATIDQALSQETQAQA